MLEWPKTKQNTLNLDWLVQPGLEELLYKQPGAGLSMAAVEQYIVPAVDQELHIAVVVELHIVVVVVVVEPHMVVAVDQAGNMLEEGPGVAVVVVDFRVLGSNQ